MLIKKLFAALISLQLIILPLNAYADEQVVNIGEGEPAPFSGTLFNAEASARIVIELEHSQQSCDLRINEATELLTARHTFEIDVLKASLDSCNGLCTTRLDIRQNQIDFLNEQVTKKKPIYPVLYFIAGSVLGVGLTLGASYAYGNVVN